MEPTRSKDVSSIVAGKSLMANWLSLDPFLRTGTIIFSQVYQKILSKTFLLNNLKTLLDTYFKFQDRAEQGWVG